MTDQTLSPSAIIVMEHIMRSVREATDMDAVDRALLNLVLHQALSSQQRLHDANMLIQHAEIERRVAMLRSLRAEIGKLQLDMDAVQKNNEQLNELVTKLGAELAKVRQEPDETADKAWKAGYERPAETVRMIDFTVDSWWGRGIRLAQAESRIEFLESLTQSLTDHNEALGTKVAELDAALATARLAVAQQVAVMPDPVVEAPVIISIETAVTDAPQQLARHHNGNGVAAISMAPQNRQAQDGQG